jgi:hypothetical protein
MPLPNPIPYAQGPRKSYEGSFNYRRDDDKPTYDPPELECTACYPLTVDGVEVRGVWYADTSAGIAKAYLDENMNPNEMPFLFRSARRLPADVEAIEMSDGQYLLSRTLRGKVEIWGPDED